MQETKEAMKQELLLRDPSADVIEYIMTGSEHCFNYWHTINDLTQTCVSAEVIAFLNAHKNDP